MNRHLFTDWSRVAAQIRLAPLTALFLDFDGTLARLRPRPEQAVLYRPLRRLLASLASNPKFRVWVISGRRLHDVRTKVCIPHISYLGLHGWEDHEGTALKRSTQRALAEVRAAVAAIAISGVWVEDKGSAFTVHHREVREEEERARARAALDCAVTPHKDLFRIAPGKCVWEVLPREIGDKGVSVSRHLKMLSAAALPVYAGDDRGDEPAFAALRSGITIRVGGNRLTHARYRLSGVQEMADFLGRLKAEFA